MNDAVGRRRLLWWGGALVVLLTLAAHVSCLRGEFLEWDDNNHITRNPLIRSLSWHNLQAMFTEPAAKLYVPLTWLSLAVDYQVWGREPLGYHLNNLLLHIANTVLVLIVVYRVLSRLPSPGTNDDEGWGPRAAAAVLSDSSAALPRTHFLSSRACRGICVVSRALAVTTKIPRKLGMTGVGLDPDQAHAVVALVAAALFGVHPLRVESVAWATERKDVLFAFFYLLALGAYLPWAGNGRRSGYWGCLVMFIAAALSKSAAITLPAVLLLLDHFIFRRRAWLEKLPFFGVSLLLGLATVAAQAGGTGETVAAADYIPWSARPGLVGYCALFYPGKFYWPFRLSAMYPTFEEMHWTARATALWLGGFVLLTGLLLLSRRRWPALWPCWLFYLITLSPTIGLLPVGIHVVADRYCYLPFLGLAVATGFAVTALVISRSQWLQILAGVTGLLVVADLALLTRERTAVWQTTETLFQSVLASNPRNLPAHINLCYWYTLHRQYGEAVDHGRAAVAIAPASPSARKNLAVALVHAGQPADAVAVLEPVLHHPLASDYHLEEVLAEAQRRLKAAPPRTPGRPGSPAPAPP